MLWMLQEFVDFIDLMLWMLQEFVDFMLDMVDSNVRHVLFTKCLFFF